MVPAIFPRTAHVSSTGGGPRRVVHRSLGATGETRGPGFAWGHAEVTQAPPPSYVVQPPGPPAGAPANLADVALCLARCGLLDPSISEDPDAVDIWACLGAAVLEPSVAEALGASDLTCERPATTRPVYAAMQRVAASEPSADLLTDLRRGR